jgi:hypothetical protein
MTVELSLTSIAYMQKAQKKATQQTVKQLSNLQPVFPGLSAPVYTRTAA